MLLWASALQLGIFGLTTQRDSPFEPLAASLRVRWWALLRVGTPVILGGTPCSFSEGGIYVAGLCGHFKEGGKLGGFLLQGPGQETRRAGHRARKRQRMVEEEWPRTINFKRKTASQFPA